MAIKLRVRIGDIEVEFEGPEAYADKKIWPFLSDTSKGSRPAGTAAPPPPEGQGGGDSGNVKSLGSFLKESKAKDNQRKKFLATATWLHRRGNARIKTVDVTKILSDMRQGSLKNAADCLNKNVSLGFCEKEGKEFYVTDEGRESLLSST